MRWLGVVGLMLAGCAPLPPARAPVDEHGPGLWVPITSLRPGISIDGPVFRRAEPGESVARPGASVYVRDTDLRRGMSTRD